MKTATKKFVASRNKDIAHDEAVAKRNASEAAQFRAEYSLLSVQIERAEDALCNAKDELRTAEPEVREAITAMIDDLRRKLFALDTEAKNLRASIVCADMIAEDYQRRAEWNRKFVANYVREETTHRAEF
jgi:hypothetical protein